MCEIQVKQKEQPLDTVSMIIWDPFMQDGYGFIAASWDGKIRYYHINGKQEINNVWEFFVEHPILCCDIGPNNFCFVGLASGHILAISMQSSQTVLLGNHEAPICGIFWINQLNTLMTLGYDNLIRAWSIQQDNDGSYLQAEFQLPCKTNTVSFDFPYLLIGSEDFTIAIINLTRIDTPTQYQQIGDYKFSKFISSRILSQAKQVILGTFDGRAVILQFQDNQAITINKPFVTKTQKSSLHGRVDLYGQTNAVDLGYFNSSAFAIIGGTEDLNVFNLNLKNIGKKITNVSTSIGATTASRITSDNRYLAYATGQDWVKGIEDLQNAKKIKICVITFQSDDLNKFVKKP